LRIKTTEGIAFLF